MQSVVRIVATNVDIGPNSVTVLLALIAAVGSWVSSVRNSHKSADVKDIVQAVLKELSPNHGSSTLDKINAIKDTVESHNDVISAIRDSIEQPK